LTRTNEHELPSLSFVLVKGYPKAWQEFWEPVYRLSRSSGIDLNAALEVFKLVHECVSKEEEGRPLSTGFLIGDVSKLEQSLPDLVGMQLQRQSIFELSKTMRSFFGLVDGHTSAFMIERDGTVQDARLLPPSPPDPKENSFTYVEFNGYCDALKDSSSYALVALGAFKTAKLFCYGKLHAEVYFSGKTGDWVHRSLAEVCERLEQVTSEMQIDPRILHKIFTVAITMSNHRKGGTIVLGDQEEVLAQSESPRLRLRGTNILNLKGRQERHLFNLATQEFALLIDSDGCPVASSVRLMARLPENAKPEVTASDGGRHRSAAEISASTNSVAFVVSDDGPITVFFKGKRLLRV
jgi:DNA integrity scanning protein DisA with diadenylate cyclase activity